MPVDVQTAGAVYIESIPAEGATFLSRQIVVVKASAIKKDPGFFEELKASQRYLGYSAIGILRDIEIETSDIISLQYGKENTFPILVLPPVTGRSGDPEFKPFDSQKQDFPELSGDFGEFADIIFGDRKISSVVERLSRILLHDVAYKDILSKDLHISSSSDEFSENLKLYPLKEILRFFPSCSIMHSKRKIGHLVVSPDKGNFINISLRELGIIANAMIAIRLLAERQLQYFELEKKYRDQLVKDLLYNRVHSREEVENRAQSFGWSFENRVVVMIISPETSERSLLDTSIVKSRVKVFFPYVAYAEVRNSIVFLISPAQNDDRVKDNESFYETVLQIADELNSDSSGKVSIAAGGFRDGILKVHESYLEAQRALKVLRMYSLENNVAIWDRLGSYKLLSTLDIYREASTFCEKQLGPLVKYDKEHNSDLLATLYALEKNNWNLSSTSSEINVHYNTMKYRYKNIADILSIDLEDSENRFNLALSLRLYKMSRS